MGELWSILIQRPLLNLLVVLYWLLRGNFGIAIILLTVLVRLLTLPLTLKQLRSMKVTQDIQPELEELRKKYGGDRQRFAQEQMRLYRERGVNPLGGCLPMILQMPIWIGLYNSLYRVMGDTPEKLIDLYKQLYSSQPFIAQIARTAVPFKLNFLWLDLGRPDHFYVLPVLVGLSTWLVQKMTPTTAQEDPKKPSVAQTMQVTMPLMMGFMAVQFSSGLALYWLASNVMQMVQQYFTSGWGDLAKYIPQRWARRRAEPVPASSAEGPSTEAKGGKGRGKVDTRRKRKRRH